MDAVERLEKENARLRAEIQRLETFRAMTFRDQLTGLSNRRYFEDRLHQELARAKRWNWSCSILLTDIDHFETINQVHGVGAGDEVLVWMARFLERSIREIDIPCRVGGDDFAIILPYTNQQGARAVADRLSTWSQQESLPRGVTLQLSLGSSTFPVEATTMSDLIGSADDALYLDKQRKTAAAHYSHRSLELTTE